MPLQCSTPVCRDGLAAEDGPGQTQPASRWDAEHGCVWTASTKVARLCAGMLEVHSTKRATRQRGTCGIVCCGSGCLHLGKQ
jgi:hypothetical protein